MEDVSKAFSIKYLCLQKYTENMLLLIKIFNNTKCDLCVVLDPGSSPGGDACFSH